MRNERRIIMLKSYNARIIATKTNTEYWLYDEPIFYGYSGFSKKNRKKPEEMDYDELYLAALRRKRYLINLRHTISRIIDANVTDKTSFLTLTFADNITDLTWANSELTKFIKRFKNHTKLKVKYLWTWEKQKRGAIHYHLVLFNISFISLYQLNKLWKHGFVQINKLEIDSSHNIGRYISKYFSKAFENRELYNVKLYGRSRNLKMPIEKLIKTDTVKLEKEICMKSCYSSEYYQKVDNNRLQRVRYYVINNVVR